MLPAADEWTQFRGPARDGHATMFQAPKTWPETPREVWKVEVGKGFASPVVSDGRIYLMARQGEDEDGLLVKDVKQLARLAFGEAATKAATKAATRELKTHADADG